MNVYSTCTNLFPFSFQVFYDDDFLLFLPGLLVCTLAIALLSERPIVALLAGFYKDENKRPYYLKGEPSKEIYNTRGHTRVYPTLVRSSKTAVGSNELRVFF